MLNPKRQVENSLLRRLTAGATLCALLATAIATAWLTRGNVQAANLALPEPLQQAVTSVLPPENDCGCDCSGDAETNSDARQNQSS